MNIQGEFLCLFVCSVYPSSRRKGTMNIYKLVCFIDVFHKRPLYLLSAIISYDVNTCNNNERDCNVEKINNP